MHEVIIWRLSRKQANRRLNAYNERLLANYHCIWVEIMRQRLTDRFKLFTVVAAMLASVGPSLSASSKDNFIGVVMEKTGSWTMKTASGTKALNENDSVPEGAELIAGSDTDTIRVLLVDKKIINRVGRQDRMKKITLSAAPSPLDRWYKALKYLHENPERFVFTIRGTVAKLSDGVAQLDGTKVDLSNILAEAKPGSYRIQMRKVGDDLSTMGPKTKMVSVEWDNKQATVEIPEANSGLWQLRTIDQFDEPQDAAWVLVSGKDTYADNCKLYQEAVTMLKSTSAKDDSRKRRILLNYLASLAESGSHKSETR